MAVTTCIVHARLCDSTLRELDWFRLAKSWSARFVVWVWCFITPCDSRLHQLHLWLAMLVIVDGVILYLQVKLSDYIGKKYVILFFYPLDFTFVYPIGALTIMCSLTAKVIQFGHSEMHAYKHCRDYCF